jgi:hypothetical protein
MPDWIPRLMKHDYFLLLLLWAILTAVNIDKAFHIDDTFHLEAAEWIKNNPANPMSGFINWGDVPTPIYTHNQPPLFFYLIALFSSIFCPCEIPLHLLLSIFTLLCLFYFYKIARIISPQNARTLLLFFAFCPALMINQNLMTDVPILAFIMASVYFLLKTRQSDKLLNYSLSSLMLGCGLMIKYSILPLFVVLILIIILRRDYKSLVVLLIPLLILSLWSFWNYVEFGSIHFLERSKGEIHINRFWAFLASLGSISAFSIPMIYGSYTLKITRHLIFVGLATFLITVMLFIFGLISQQLSTKLLNISFIINGFLVYISIFLHLINDLKLKGLKSVLISGKFHFFLFLGSISLFIVIYAPFMATRHILLIIPFILLFGHELINKATRELKWLSLTIGVFLSVVLGISDWKYADYYRQMPMTIDLPQDRTTWTVGHWGWQWYSEKNGMKQYDTLQLEIKEGDYIVYPGDISRQKIAGNISLILIDKKWKEADMLTLFSGNSFASLYNSTYNKPPWNLSQNPIDTILIYKIERIENDTTFNGNQTR